MHHFDIDGHEAGEVALVVGLAMVIIGAGVISLWGVSHIVPTRTVVRDFGAISKENRLLLTMDWISSGMALVFIGMLSILVAVVGTLDNPVSLLVLRACGGMLVVFALISAMTGGRTNARLYTLCPLIKASSGILVILGTVF